jgi:hypothetical protein
MSTTTEPPFQTFERMTGEKWPGGKSEVIVTLLKLFRIEDAPGSAAANLRLQSYLLNIEEMFEPFRLGDWPAFPGDPGPNRGDFSTPRGSHYPGAYRR